MGPITAIRTCLSKYFTWRGRARRAEFWWFFLLYFGGIFGYILYSVTMKVEVTEEDVGPVVIYMTAMLLPFLAVMARRLHDKGLTAWLMLLCFIPFGQIALLILAALPGDAGPNNHGEDPLGRSKQGLAYGSSRIPVVRDED